MQLWRGGGLGETRDTSAPSTSRRSARRTAALAPAAARHSRPRRAAPWGPWGKAGPPCVRIALHHTHHVRETEQRKSSPDPGETARRSQEPSWDHIPPPKE